MSIESVKKEIEDFRGTSAEEVSEFKKTMITKIASMSESEDSGELLDLASQLKQIQAVAPKAPITCVAKINECISKGLPFFVFGIFKEEDSESDLLESMALIEDALPKATGRFLEDLAAARDEAYRLYTLKTWQAGLERVRKSISTASTSDETAKCIASFVATYAGIICSGHASCFTARVDICAEELAALVKSSNLAESKKLLDSVRNYLRN